MTEPFVDPRAEVADLTLLGLLADEIHEFMHPHCVESREKQGDDDGGATCFDLAYELTLQGWTLPEAPPPTMADLLK